MLNAKDIFFVDFQKIGNTRAKSFNIDTDKLNFLVLIFIFFALVVIWIDFLILIGSNLGKILLEG